MVSVPCVTNVAPDTHSAAVDAVVLPAADDVVVLLAHAVAGSAI